MSGTFEFIKKIPNRDIELEVSGFSDVVENHAGL
jgi:hypothetical protein